MIDGPGPPLTVRLTGSPIALESVIRCALMRRSDREAGGVRETHRILLLWSFGGDCSGLPQTIPAISPDLPSAYGIRGFGSEKPPRAHIGSTPIATVA